MAFENTHMGMKFFNRDIPALIDSINRVADGLDKLNQPSKEEHYHELLNSIINHVSNCENNSTTIKTLLYWGFTVKDLVQDFNFSESDVKDYEEGLDIKISERADIVDDIAIHKDTLKTLEAALKDATEARSACEENLNQIRKKKKQIVTQMKRNRDMKDIYDDLEGIGAGDHTSKLLDKVIEKGDDLADVVAGSKEAYETKTSTRAKKVDQRLKSSANDDYKQQLLNKYKK